jgi:cob(I)alamin adenosyltransferase
VLLVRFLKPAAPPSGELKILEQLAGLEIVTAGIGVVNRRTAPEAVAASVAGAFAEGRRRILAGAVDLAILDEANNALHRGDLPLADILSLIEARPSHVELVFTGRHAPAALLARADLVTDMEAVRHPFAAGIPARRGIEY